MPRGIYPAFAVLCEKCGAPFKTRNPNLGSRACSLQCHFDLFVEKRGPQECWPWKGFCDDDGYGEFRFKGKKWRAHRAAFFLKHRRLPHGRLIMHSCDNPPCCNPAHLSSGTIASNTADMDQKGRRRSARGVDAGNAALTDAKVRFIRRSKMSARKLAARFGVKDQCIYKVRQGIRWRHVQ